MLDTVLGLVVIHAEQEPGEPICIAADSDNGLGINLYLKDEAVVGVLIYDEQGFLITAHGLLPRETIEEERALQSGCFLEEWGDASEIYG